VFEIGNMNGSGGQGKVGGEKNLWGGADGIIVTTGSASARFVCAIRSID
jgi:hypothetical protein